MIILTFSNIASKHLSQNSQSDWFKFLPYMLRTFCFHQHLSRNFSLSLAPLWRANDWLKFWLKCWDEHTHRDWCSYGMSNDRGCKSGWWLSFLTTCLHAIDYITQGNMAVPETFNVTLQMIDNLGESNMGGFLMSPGRHLTTHRAPSTAVSNPLLSAQVFIRLLSDNPTF